KSENSEADTEPDNETLRQSKNTEQMSFALAQLKSVSIWLNEEEEKAKALSKQFSASERTESKLLQQVYQLGKNLDAVDLQDASREPYENTVLTKDQYIEKLQAEVKASRKQLKVHKLKHQKTVKKLQIDLATTKQEAAITVLELNEKIKTLCEREPAPRAANLLEECCESLLPEEEGDRKISLITELSIQLSLQTERIIQLEAALEEKERKIQQLEAERNCHLPQEVMDPPQCLE
uniref:Coiled-coil domain containing 192 n=1 Tax=Cavia porcellus TaxID=10141 RepID=A0A286XTN7_CAVPO